MMNLDQLKSQAPSVFATQASPLVSNQYVFVPTMDILENFQNAGWDIASARQTGKTQYAVHEIRLRNGELPKVGDTLVEAIIRNSHNGMSTLSVSAGLHRLVCSNGLTVPTSTAESFKVKHQRFDLDDVKRLTESFASKLPKIEMSVNRMMEKELSTDEKIDFLRNFPFFKVSGSKQSIFVSIYFGATIVVRTRVVGTENTLKKEVRTKEVQTKIFERKTFERK